MRKFTVHVKDEQTDEVSTVHVEALSSRLALHKALASYAEAALECEDCFSVMVYMRNKHTGTLEVRQKGHEDHCFTAIAIEPLQIVEA